MQLYSVVVTYETVPINIRACFVTPFIRDRAMGPYSAAGDIIIIIAPYTQNTEENIYYRRKASCIAHIGEGACQAAHARQT